MHCYILKKTNIHNTKRSCSFTVTGVMYIISMNGTKLKIGEFLKII